MLKPAIAVIPPTRIRWRIYGLLLVVITLTFIDRFNMNVAAKYIQQEFSFSDVQIGSLLSAFVLGYAVFQAPGGWLGDKFGARSVLTFAIIWWSIFTALTAAAPKVFPGNWFGVAGSFWIVRFLIGVGEAPALPNTNKMIGRWMAVSERARGSSLFLVAVGIGGAFTPPLIAWIMTHWGWRLSFVVCGGLGLVVAVLWHFRSTEAPEYHPSVNAEELSLISANREDTGRQQSFPWLRIFTGTSVPALLIANFMLGYVTYIFYTWFFLYLVNVRHMPVISGSYWSTAPFLAMLVGAPLGGGISDWMVRKLGLRWGRRLPVLVAACASCLLLILGSRMIDPYRAIALLAFAAGCNSVAAVSSWTLPNDLSDRHSGFLAGVLNTATNLGGALSPVLTPALAARIGWVGALDVAAAQMLCIALLWLLVHAERRID
jgi:ACS family glucarate transporter-like MFS transporter